MATKKKDSKSKKTTSKKKTSTKKVVKPVTNNEPEIDIEDIISSRRDSVNTYTCKSYSYTHYPR